MSATTTTNQKKETNQHLNTHCFFFLLDDALWDTKPIATVFLSLCEFADVKYCKKTAWTTMMKTEIVFKGEGKNKRSIVRATVALLHF